MTPAARTILGAAASCMVLLAGLSQPSGDPAPVFSAMEPAPGVPWHGHVMLAPEQGVILGCWSPDYPADLGDATACWWSVATGERHDLADPVVIGGVEHLPRFPAPGVDAATGATVWHCRSASGAWAPAVLVVPGVARSADFNGDGTVDTRDVTAFLAAWAAQREIDQ